MTLSTIRIPPCSQIRAGYPLGREAPCQESRHSPHRSVEERSGRWRKTLQGARGVKG